MVEPLVVVRVIDDTHLLCPKRRGSTSVKIDGIRHSQQVTDVCRLIDGRAVRLGRREHLAYDVQSGGIHILTRPVLRECRNGKQQRNSKQKELSFHHGHYYIVFQLIEWRRPLRASSICFSTVRTDRLSLTAISILLICSYLLIMNIALR